jgi:hypothetical protein
MTEDNIKLINEDGKIVGKNAKTGQRIPISFEAVNADRMNNAVVARGNRLQAIQDAHDRLPADGGEIYLVNHRYGFDFLNESKLSITKDDITIRGCSRSSEIFLEDETTNTEEGADILEVRGANFELVGVTIDGNYLNNSPGEQGTVSDGHSILLTGDEGVVRNCNIRKSTGDGVEISSGAQRCRVENNLFIDNWEHNVGLNGCEGVIVADNILTGEQNNSSIGTYNGTGAPPTSHCDITGNMLLSPDSIGIKITSGIDKTKDIHVADNIIRNAALQGIVVRTSSKATGPPENITIKDNQIVGGSSRAIELRGADGVTIDSNEIKDNDKEAIRAYKQFALEDCAIINNQIIDNNAADAGATAVRFNNGSNNFPYLRIKNNDIISTGSVLHQAGIQLGNTDTGQYVESEVSGNTVRRTKSSEYVLSEIPDRMGRNVPQPSVNVRKMQAIRGNRGYHNGSGSNTSGPAFYNGDQWVSLVDESIIS